MEANFPTVKQQRTDLSRSPWVGTNTWTRTGAPSSMGASLQSQTHSHSIEMNLKRTMERRPSGLPGSGTFVGPPEDSRLVERWCQTRGHSDGHPNRMPCVHVFGAVHAMWYVALQ